MQMKHNSDRADMGGRDSESYYVVKIDAPPGVEVPGGCYVTVQSGPHMGLSRAYGHLRDPKPRAHTLPDIVFLPSSATVLSIDEKVALKPYLLARALDVDSARIRRDRRGSTSSAGKRSVPTHGLKTPPGKMGPPVQIIDSMEKGVDAQDSKRARLGKLSPKTLFPDDGRKESEEQPQSPPIDNVSALRAACAARLMWMISNPQYQMALASSQQKSSQVKEEEDEAGGITEKKGDEENDKKKKKEDTTNDDDTDENV